MERVIQTQCLCKICSGNSEICGVVDFNKNCRERNGKFLKLSGIPIYYYRCESCGLLFTTYFDEWSYDDFSRNIYNEEYKLVDPDYEKIRPEQSFEMVSNLIGNHSSLNILDFGGGSGRLAQLLTEKGNFAFTYDPISKVSSIHADMKFDLVTAIEVFEHTANPKHTAETIIDFLSDEGAVLFTTLTIENLPVHDMNYWYISPRNGHITIYTLKSLDKLFNDLGYSVHHIDSWRHIVYKKLPEWLSPGIYNLPKSKQLAAPVEQFAKLTEDCMPDFNEIKDCRYGKMIYNKLDAYVGKSLNNYGEFSEGEFELFKQIVREGNIILEIGANIGAHTVALSRIVGQSGTVFAFEPQRLVFQVLAGNLAINSITNTFCYQKAVGELPGTLMVPLLDFEKENNWGGLSLGSWEQGEVVDVITVDSMDLPFCHFIKIDVEGMELDVLKGAKQTIDKYQPIMYVENDREEKSVALIKYLLMLGYELYWHCPLLFNSNNYYGNKENVFGNIVSKNMLCIPKSKNVNLNGFEKVIIAGE
ncbi:MAG: FkbM family methyltransferase [Negativicutes bacterium]